MLKNKAKTFIQLNHSLSCTQQKFSCMPSSVDRNEILITTPRYIWLPCDTFGHSDVGQHYENPHIQTCHMYLKLLNPNSQCTEKKLTRLTLKSYYNSSSAINTTASHLRVGHVAIFSSWYKDIKIMTLSPAFYTNVEILYYYRMKVLYRNRYIKIDVQCFKGCDFYDICTFSNFKQVTQKQIFTKNYQLHHSCNNTNELTVQLHLHTTQTTPIWGCKTMELSSVDSNNKQLN